MQTSPLLSLFFSLLLLCSLTLATPISPAGNPKDALDGLVNFVRVMKGEGLQPGTKAYAECLLAKNHSRRSAKGGGRGGGGGKGKGKVEAGGC